MKKILMAMFMACFTSVFAQTESLHTVQRGETLESIATKYGVTVDALKQANKDAQQYLYAGMKLVIPHKANAVHPSTGNIKENGETRVYDPNSITSFSSEKNNNDGTDLTLTWGFTYMAGTFDDIKVSGHYGIMVETYDIKSSGLGFGGILGSFNFGLVDSDFASDLIQIGPNYSFLLGSSNNSRLIIPFYINYSSFGEKYKELTGKSDAWGWSINPKIYFGCIQAGLLFSGGFEESSVSTGFSAALVF